MANTYQSPFQNPYGFNSNNFQSFVSPFLNNNQTKTKGSTNVTYKKMNPIYQSGTKSYDTYKGSDGNYYYKDGNTYKKADASMSKTIAANKYICFGNPSSSNTNISYNQAKQTIATQGSGGSSGGSSGGGGGGSVNNFYYEKLLDQYKKELDELKNPKVWTADELAEKHGLKDQYDYDKILQMYNDATNKYYTDAVNAQRIANMDSERSNAGYANNLLNSYLSGYSNAAPTAVGRGTLAANALSTMLGADVANEEASSNLNSIINSYNEAWKKELAENATTARTQYNDMGKTLLQLGAAYNTAEVQNYINALNAYDTAYTGIRNAQNNLASTTAAAYQNNANAALARNQYNNANAMSKYYQAYYGNNGNAWQKAYRNVLDDQATTNTQKSSAN